MSALSRSGRPGRKQSMRKQYKDRETRRNRILFITALAIALMLIAAVAFDAVGTLLYWMASEAEAEEIEGRQCWVLCMPDSVVNIRRKPGGEIFGGATCGSDMLTDEKIRNGYLHVYDLAAEESEGWISTRYIVYDEPVAFHQKMTVRADGRVACRKWIGGKVSGWVNDGDNVFVYSISYEWAVTDRGYIRSEFLE